MEGREIQDIINLRYPMDFVKIEQLREGGNATYAAYTATGKYFLKVVGAAFSDTFRQSVDINIYLREKDFSVPRIIMTSDNRPFVKEKSDCVIIIYEFLETTEIDVEKDAEEVGALIGRLHNEMEGYGGELVTHNREFYLERYLRILRNKRYPKADEFASYGDKLWDRVKSLPRGYSHGDMYSGNIARGADGKLYVLDFDTSCIGFPTYDLALICNQTDYFKYDTEGLPKTAAVYNRMLPEYLKRHVLSGREINSIYDMLALYHFALQATIIEIYGPDCVDNAFFDRQLGWLNRWENQCKGSVLRLY